MKRISYDIAKAILKLFESPLPDKKMKKEIVTLIDKVYQEGYETGKNLRR